MRGQPFQAAFKGFVRQEFRLESYMTSHRGHRLDVLELLLAHLGDDALLGLQALLSGFCPRLQHNPGWKIAKWRGGGVKVLASAGDCIKLMGNKIN